MRILDNRDEYYTPSGVEVIRKQALVSYVSMYKERRISIVDSFTITYVTGVKQSQYYMVH
jgi:hypothetical protein